MNEKQQKPRGQLDPARGATGIAAGGTEGTGSSCTAEGGTGTPVPAVTPARTGGSPSDTLDLTGIGAVDAAAAAGVETEPGDYAFVEPGSERGPRVVAAAPEPLLDRRLYRAAKRLFDIAFSGAVVAVGLVPGALLCLAIRLESPGCPIYVQQRVGRITRRGEVRTFPMLKFRSMYRDADERLEELRAKNEADGPLFKIKDDPRVTKIGKFIRKHSIDEFPQWIGYTYLDGFDRISPAFLNSTGLM